MMMGVGGICGALLGGEITNNMDPYYVFYIVSLFGCLISAFGLTLKPSIEAAN